MKTMHARQSGKHRAGAYLTALLLLLSFVSWSQSRTIQGNIQDARSKPVGFANIILLKAADSSVVTTGTSDSSGRFQLAVPTEGSYVLRISAIGFKELITERFDGTAAPANRFSNLVMQPESRLLDDVTITAMRPVIVQLADRMVVNVEGTAMAAGNNAFTVLSRSPGVFVDADGNIQLNGRAGVTVMIDGRLTYMNARDLRNYLEGLSAEHVKNIEIITNPSARYDAEGTSGIININLKKNARRGMNGSVYSSYTYNFKQHGYSAGGNMNVKSGRWNAFLQSDFIKRAGGREATFTRVFYGSTQTTYFDQTAIGNFSVQGPPSVRSGADYQINGNHSIGFLANYTRSTARQEFLTDTYIGSAPKQPAQYIDADNISRNTFSNLTTNLHYNGKLDSSGTSISTDLDYVRISNKGSADLNNYFTDLTNGVQNKDLLHTITPNAYDIYSARLDIGLPLKKGHKLETGGRASRIESDNDFRFYFNNNGLTLDPARTNHFLYRESILAGYLNWNGPLSKNWTLQAGLRVEHTNSRGHSLTTSQVNSRKYTDFFPSVFLQQKVSDNYGVNYSYSRRLTRPNYGNLNPFRAYRDPYTWYEGNTELKPQYTHSFSVAQVIRKNYTLTVSYQLSKDVMAEIPILFVDDTTTVYTTGNVNDGHSLAMSAVGPVKLAGWWDSQNTLLLSYNKFSMESNNGQLENDQLFFMLQSNHTIQLPRKIRMELNILFRGPAASGLYHMASMHRVDVAFKRSFLEKKFDLTVNVNDIFKGFRYLWTTNINGNVNEFDQYFRWRSIGLSLRYNFSKGQKVNLKQRTAIEEVNRT